jgi:acetyl esterase/lipase
MSAIFDSSSATLRERAQKNYNEVRYAVKEIIDVPYNLDPHTAHWRHKLDVYVPVVGAAAQSADAKGPRRLPVVIFIPGGGWKKGKKRGAAFGLHENVGRSLAAAGYVAVIPNYRLSHVQLSTMVVVHGLFSSLVGGILYACAEAVQSSVVGTVLAFLMPFALGLSVQPLWSRSGPATFPAHAEDAALAVAWTFAHIAEYGGDVDNVHLMGHSAGGHIAAMLLLKPDMLATATQRCRAAGGASGAAATSAENKTTSAAAAAKDGAAAMPLLLNAHVDTHSVTFPPVRFRSAVLLSGVYSAALLSDQAALDAGRWWHWPSALARRAMYMRPVFGDDSSKWEAAFPEFWARDPTAVAALRLPPLLLVNASEWRDWTLNAHTDAFEPLLRAAAAVSQHGMHIERATIRGTDHIGYVAGIGHCGSAHRPLTGSGSGSKGAESPELQVRPWTRLLAGQEITLPLVASFLGRYATAAPHGVAHRLAFAPQ